MLEDWEQYNRVIKKVAKHHHGTWKGKDINELLTMYKIWYKHEEIKAPLIMLKIFF